MTIKAIETRYRGYRFRSRLEARWAVYFTALGLAWEYEPEGFDLGAVGWYLPDFFLPELHGGMWVEVKPHGKADPADEAKWVALVEETARPLFYALGTPEIRSYTTLWPEDESSRAWGCAGPYWGEVCFNQKYLPPRNHDGKPRLFWQPGSIEDCDCFDAVEAAKGARFEHGEFPA